MMYIICTMNSKEDQTAPIGQSELEQVLLTNPDDRRLIVNRIFGFLNERRDTYNGIASSMLYIIRSQDDALIEMFEKAVIDQITCNPIRYGGKMFLTRTLFRLIEEEPQFIASMFEKIITSKTDWESNFDERSQIVNVQIIALKTIRLAEYRTGGKLVEIPQEQIDELCNLAMLICDDDTKVDTLQLLLETRTTTKILTERELNVFGLSFRNALAFQEPSLRQKFLALTNKLIKRLNDGLEVVMRDKKRFTIEDEVIIKTRYFTFIEWLVEFCLDSIYCNAYFGSFILTMSTLKMIIEHIKFSNKHLHIMPLFVTRRFHDSILSCLSDSFEENKALALDLLFLLPNNEQFTCDNSLKRFEQVAYHLVGSVNPAHSLTCQYVFKLIINLKFKQMASINMTKNQLIYEHLTKLVGLVEKGVEETQKNFIEALKYNAIYPKLTCIRALLDEIDITDLESRRDEWKTLAKRIVKLSIDACQAISMVVCNLNPETIGHLPMDLKPVDVEALAKTLNVSLNIETAKLQSISSQMLLISGWKTIKECSLSMGAMCVRFWWPKNRIRGKREKFPGLSSEPILEAEDIIRIIEFFGHYLRNLRHRGAFEQAYNGFSIVTKRIWHEPLYKDLLISILSEIMNDFKEDTKVPNDAKRVEYLKAYVTRRSAGLPFIVQAILNSESKQDSATLRWVMESLFEILENPKSEIYQRIHCLNILRALIKEHCLGEKVIPYIGQTLMITMKSFTSDSFPIRNCANMLLKATVDRAFGVNRLRDDIHMRNKLSFKKFFSACEGLHQEMLRRLEDGLHDKKCLAAVHSVFIILFRLRPSLNRPIDNHEFTSEKIITPFVEPIKSLAYTCPDLKLRELAAKLTVQLESYCVSTSVESIGWDKCGQVIHELSEIILSKREPRYHDLNELHGALLLTKFRLEKLEKFKANEEERQKFLLFAREVVKTILVTHHPSLSSYCSNVPNNYNTIKMVALDVVESYNLFHLKDAAHDWLSDLNPVISNLESLITDSSSQVSATANALSPWPYFESVVFKLITNLLMSLPDSGASIDGDEQEHELCTGFNDLDRVISLMIAIIVRKPDRMLSNDLQASLIRFLRQLLTGSEDFVDKLCSNLDTDTTAAHVTPFDRLNGKIENDTERERWASYCQQHKLRSYMRKLSASICERLYGSTDCSGGEYIEFAPRISHSSSHPERVFTSRLSNTPRSLELLAFACKSEEAYEAAKNLWQVSAQAQCATKGAAGRLESMTKFIDSLPDCDIKCFAILYAARYFRHYVQTTQVLEGDLLKMDQFTATVEGLADGHHSYVIRDTCCETLSLTLKAALTKNRGHPKSLVPQKSLMNLLSALIKLCQDEEQGIRQRAYKIMTIINDEQSSLRVSHGTLSSGGSSRLDQLISLVSSELFDPNNQQDVTNCFDLSMRIIFNHTRNYTSNEDENRERLFDKTKLNTFADHVATIQSALAGLRLFFSCYEGSDIGGSPTTCQSHLVSEGSYECTGGSTAAATVICSTGLNKQRVDLNSLRFSQDVLHELDIVTAPLLPAQSIDYTSGDYSWRLKKSLLSPTSNADVNACPGGVAGVKGSSCEHLPLRQQVDNNAKVDIILENILTSLDYFSQGHWNMLTDTEYTHHELSLFKKIAFVKFVLDCTKYNLKNEHLIVKIQQSLLKIAAESCFTTIMSKCLELIK